MLRALQRWVLYPRHMVSPDDSVAPQLPGLERWWHESPQGRVEAWFLPGDGVTGENPGPAVLFAHGNAEVIELWPPMLAPYRRLGVSLLLPEYRGYGRSAGKPSQAAIGEDFLAFYDRLAADPGVDPARLVFHGRSLGGGAVCALAGERPPRAMILESTFTSVREMARRFLLPGFLVADPFDSLGVLRELQPPLLLFHGKWDSLVPYRHGRRIHEAVAGSELVTYGCDHNDLPPDPRDYWQRIEGFLSGLDVV